MTVGAKNIIASGSWFEVRSSGLVRGSVRVPRDPRTPRPAITSACPRNPRPAARGILPSGGSSHAEVRVPGRRCAECVAARGAAAHRRCPAGVDDGGLCPRGEVSGCQRGAAGLPRRRCSRRGWPTTRSGTGSRPRKARRPCWSTRQPARAVRARSRSARARAAGADAARGGTDATPPAKRRQSPDGKRTAFIRDWNLWVRDVATGKETQLTTDGVKDFGYATDNAGWTQQRPADPASGRPTRRRSRRSSRTSATSARCTSSSTQVGHPTLQAWKYPLPGDEHVAMIQRVVIDVDAAKVVRLQDAARSASLDALRRHRVPRRRLGRRAVEPGRHAPSRSSRPRAITSSEQLRVADAATGDVRDVLEEKVATFFESGNGARQLALPAGVERGDLVLGARQLGPALPLRPADRQAEEPDHHRRRQRHAAAARRREERACCTSSRVGREQGRDPYFSHFYRDRLRRQEPARC